MEGTDLRACLGLLDRIAERDTPVTRLVIGDRPVVFVNQPELVRDLLVTRADSFEPSEFAHGVFPTGHSEVDQHRRERLAGLLRHRTLADGRSESP